VPSRLPRGVFEIDNTPSNTPAAAPAVIVSDLHKSYGDLDVLKGVSLTANQGDVISIIGASGSGKSTLLRCINLLELPSAGTLQVGPEQIRFKAPRKGVMEPADDKQVRRVRTNLGMVFQSFNLWPHMTVLQNVTEAPVHVLGLSKAEARERAERMLERVGMWEPHRLSAPGTGRRGRPTRPGVRQRDQRALPGIRAISQLTPPDNHNRPVHQPDATQRTTP